MTNKNEEEIQVDLKRLFLSLWHRLWAIVLVAAICGCAAFCYTKLCITPMYRASIIMYVNSTSTSDDRVSISQGELNTAKSLVETYAVILKTHAVLDDVIKEANLTCSFSALSNAISASSINKTEVFRVNVVNKDPQQAALIANAIAEILPEKLPSIVEGSSARVLNMADVPGGPISPNAAKNTMVAFIVGFAAACAVAVVLELMDDKIHDFDYLVQAYEIPILAVIPNVLADSKESYGYGYGYGHSYSQSAKNAKKSTERQGQ